MTLHAGKPMLLPEQWEQVILAWRLQQKGLALATVRVRDGAKLQALATRLLGEDTPVREAVQRFAQAKAAYDPAMAVAQVVERLLAVG